MIHIERTFPTLAEAEAWRDGYLRQFHPMGYGTTVTIRESADGWVASASRFNSCD